MRDLADAAGVVQQADLDVHSGEILGLFGLGGSGRTELLECIYGCRKRRSGTVTLAGKQHRPSPRRSLERGMVLISEDRQGKALIGGRSVEDNLLLATLSRFAWGGVYQAGAAGY